MNEAINNFNKLANGQTSIKVDARIPDAELLKVGAVLMGSYIIAFLIVALLLKSGK
jgi:hypothetical protein